MSQRLPVRPNLDHLRRHAKIVLRVARADKRGWRLADAQRALARGFGYESWAELKRHVDSTPRAAGAARIPKTAPLTARAKNGSHDCAFEGIWVSEAERRTVLAIDRTDGAIVLTQITDDQQGRSVASTLVLNDDGEEHPLPFGEDLTVRVCRQNARSLRTVVSRGSDAVAEGLYALAPDGRTLDTRVGAQRHFFTRMMPILAILIAAGVGCAARTDVHRRAIEALNQHDIKAALASDVDAVVSQWSEGFVQIPPAGPAIRGRAANVAMVAQAREQLELFQPVAYHVDVEEITVSGDYAYAWGTYRTTARRRNDGVEISQSGKLLRIYQRQKDGRWLMHRTMTTLDPKPK